jgi:hypothetical protein
LLLANLPQRLLSQFIISLNTAWGLAMIMGDGELSPPLVTGVHHLDCWEKIPPGTNRQFDLEWGFIFSASWGEGLGYTKESTEAQEPT